MSRTIDLVESLALSTAEVEAHFNELQSLDYLAQGLEALYRQTTRVEEHVLRQLPPGRQAFLFCNAPALAGVPMGLIACAFHWYAVSACNYVRLVGWLANAGDTKKASAYVKGVLPAVSLWRNKVGAHFARIDPRGDTPADLAASVLFPVGFFDDAFYVGLLRLRVVQGGQATASRGDMGWSLTHTHRDLCRRYWPEKLPPQEQVS